MQYPASFFIQAAAHFLVTGSEFLALVALFGRFGQIRGWTLAEMGLFYGIVAIAFALSEAAARGFDLFPALVRSGDFDRVLVRPRSPALQVLGQDFQLMRVGRFLQGLAVLVWSALELDIAWTPAGVVLLVMAILGGACLFTGLFVIQATLCFWTTESIEIMNVTTYGGVEAAQFPLSIYRPWFRTVFTFVVPLATINYLPVHAILGIADPLGSTAAVQWLSPLAGLLFMLACFLFWRFGVRHYTSTGS
jgi:ABC-2 type transport system permease protein